MSNRIKSIVEAIRNSFARLSTRRQQIVGDDTLAGGRRRPSTGAWGWHRRAPPRACIAIAGPHLQGSSSAALATRFTVIPSSRGRRGRNRHSHQPHDRQHHRVARRYGAGASFVHQWRALQLRDQTYRPGAKAGAGAAPFQSVEGLSFGADLVVRYAVDAGQISTLASKLPGRHRRRNR